MKKGLFIINTGNGKGKTTAALGLAMRALGHGFKVCIFQFIKGSWKYGELEAAKRFDDLLDFHVTGKGFTWQSKDLEKDKEAAREAWEKVKKAIMSEKYKIIILDELTYVLNYGIVDEKEVIDFLKSRPDDLHVIVTGRDASEDLIQAADLVSEIKEIKHPFKSGIKAQKGIEF